MSTRYPALLPEFFHPQRHVRTQTINASRVKQKYYLCEQQPRDFEDCTTANTAIPVRFFRIKYPAVSSDFLCIVKFRGEDRHPENGMKNIKKSRENKNVKRGHFEHYRHSSQLWHFVSLESRNSFRKQVDDTPILSSLIHFTHNASVINFKFQ